MAQGEALGQTIKSTKSAMAAMHGEGVSLGQELLNLRATFLFTSFSMMAMGRIVEELTSRFSDFRREMTDAFAQIEYQAVATSTVMVGTGERTAETMERMIELGRETEYTAVEAGEGMEVLARAGFEVQETFGAIDPVLEMARANNMAVGETARFAAGMYRGWALDAQELTFEMEEQDMVVQNLTMATTAITHAARESRMRADELAQSMKFATAAARTLGWEMEELAAGMMIAADYMIEAGMAGRSFRRAMTRIGMVAGETGRGINQARELVAEYGIQLRDEEGNVKSFADLIEELEVARRDLSEIQEINLYQQLAGMRGMNLLAAAVDEGSESIRENTRELKASSVAAALQEAGIRNVRDQMYEWRKELEGTGENLENVTVNVEDTRKNLGVTAEVAEKLNDVLTDSNITLKEFNDLMEGITITSEMVEARLKTLEGSMILLESSLEAMWASLAEGLYKEYMQIYYHWLKQLADIIGRLPGPLRAVIALSITFLSVVGRIVPQVLMLVGLYIVKEAAMASMKLETYEMIKANLDHIGVNEKQVSVMQKYIATNAKKIASQVKGITGSKRSKIVTDLESQSFYKQIMALAKLDDSITKTTFSRLKNIMATKGSSVKIDENTRAKLQNIVATKGQTNETIKHIQAVGGATGAVKALTIATFTLMGTTMALTYAYYRGSKGARTLGAALAILTVGMYLYRYHTMVAEKVNWAFIKSLFVKSKALLTAHGAAAGFIVILLIFWHLSDDLSVAIIGLAAATAVLTLAVWGLNMAGMKIWVILYAIAIIVILLVHYFTDLEGKIYDTEYAIEGNSLLPAFVNLLSVLKPVGDAFGYIIDLVKTLWKYISNLSGKLKDFGSFIVDLIGNSLIPESFESGIGRIISEFDKLDERIIDEMEMLKEFYEYTDMMIGNSLIPEAFERGMSRIKGSLEGFPLMGVNMGGGGGIGSGVSQAVFNIDMSGFTTRTDVSPEELQKIMQDAIQDSLKKWDRRARRA